ncbi:unnamed protein product [Effrenium voratum]|nr:unnamed protein product [Effrenium voratum]
MQDAASKHMPRQTLPQGCEWYLLVGTRLGTLQAFKIAELLSDLPVWQRIIGHLPKEVAASFSRTRRPKSRGKQKVPEADARLLEIEQEHAAAMELSRAPGQRPFPSNSHVQLFSRWRRHDYAVEVVKCVAQRILTIDKKRNLKVCQAVDSECIFCSQLPDFCCLTPFLTQVDDGEEPLQGLTLGTCRGSLELVLLPAQGLEAEVISSQSSHGGPVLQVDFLLPPEIFVSVGQDDAVRFWSSSLHVLREVFFPQACTAVAFLHLPDMDTAAGHGDVLVGFAAHVEQVPLEVWARGVKHESLGGNLSCSSFRSSKGQGTSKGMEKSAQEDSAILDELGGPLEAQLSVDLSWDCNEEPQPNEREAVAEDKPRTIADFRGPPVIPLGALSKVADMSGLQERFNQRPLELPHEHSQVLDQGDFKSITRYCPGYYDWTVLPNTKLDAPRGHAIRGITQENVAVVTSVGVGHLRNMPEGTTQPAEAEALTEGIMEEDDGMSRKRRGGPSPITSQAVRGFRPCSPASSRALSRRRASLEAHQANQPRWSFRFGTEKPRSKDAEAEEMWRNLHIARGVPQRAVAPLAQNVGNSDADVARMLKERGKLVDAPEDCAETNFLSRITSRKTDFVYCGVDNLNSARRTARRVMRETEDDTEGLKMWTATGRLRTGVRQPPQRALPRCYVPPPPEHLWRRAPMTRSEVTEVRIIEAAQHPPAQAEDLVLESNPACKVKLPAVEHLSRAGSAFTTDTESSGARFSKVGFAVSSSAR